MNSYCQEKGFDKWFETSAKENSNIDTAIQYLITEVRQLFTYLFF
jgi:Ras-related protein Rab-32